MTGLPPSPTGLAAAREGAGALRAYAWLIALLAVVGLVVGYATAPSADSGAYRAWITPQPLTGNRAVTELGVSTPEGPQAGDFMEDAILERVERATGYSHDYLVEHLELSQPPTGTPRPPVELIANAGSSEDSKQLLLIWMENIKQLREQRVEHALDRAQEGLEERIAKHGGPDEETVRRELINLLARLDSLRSTLTVDYSIYRKPGPLTESKSKGKSILVGGVGGLLVGIALALLVALIDGRIRSREGLEAAFDEVELLADLRPRGSPPTLEHARIRLEAIGGGAVPSPIAVVSCGEADVEAALERLRPALGEAVEFRIVLGPSQKGEALEQVVGAAACLIVAMPNGVKRRDVAGLQSELAGIDLGPTGFIIT